MATLFLCLETDVVRLSVCRVRVSSGQDLCNVSWSRSVANVIHFHRMKAAFLVIEASRDAFSLRPSADCEAQLAVYYAYASYRVLQGETLPSLPTGDRRKRGHQSNTDECITCEHDRGIYLMKSCRRTSMEFCPSKLVSFVCRHYADIFSQDVLLTASRTCVYSHTILGPWSLLGLNWIAFV
jgi:hypothetical protein